MQVNKPVLGYNSWKGIEKKYNKWKDEENNFVYDASIYHACVLPSCKWNTTILRKRIRHVISFHSDRGTKLLK